jgi:hypothetical protein
MATNAANLETALASMYAELVTVTASRSATISVRGHTYQLNEYRAQLIRDIAEMEKLAGKAGGPFVKISRSSV